MKREDIVKYFKLENNEDLFEIAIKPPSCGGGSEFDNLALEGDRVLDQAFESILNSMEILTKGDKARYRASFHNSITLSNIGRTLGFDRMLSPLDSTYVIQIKDLKEMVEALLGASFRINGLDSCISIVKNIFDLALKHNLLIENFKGLLLQFNDQQSNFTDIVIHDPVRVGGEDHALLFKATISGKFKGIKYEIESSEKRTKGGAEQDAARKYLELEFGSLQGSISLPETEQPVKVQKSVVQSLSVREILFSKTDLQLKDKIELDTVKGELLTEYFWRKAKKNPYGALMLLNAHLPEIKGAAWYATIDCRELCLYNIEIDGESYFEIGLGLSKSKARKQAAQKIINSSQLAFWLQKNHENTII